MSGYSIYQKPCPECGIILPINAVHCSCGHSFETIHHDALQPEELALQEEELFAAYLAARVDQTVAAVESARADLATDSINPRNTERLLQTVQEALTLRDERDAQAAKIAQIREAVQTTKDILLPSMTDTVTQSTQPTEGFKVEQAAKAEKIIEAFSNTETRGCPHCKTVLPITSALCCCGYIFARHDFMLPRAVDFSMRGVLYRPK